MPRIARSRRQRSKSADKPLARRTRTVSYDIAEQLRTPREMAVYLESWLNEHPDDARGLTRALRAIARAARMHLRARITHSPARTRLALMPSPSQLPV